MYSRCDERTHEVVISTAAESIRYLKTSPRIIVSQSSTFGQLDTNDCLQQTHSFFETIKTAEVRQVNRPANFPAADALYYYATDPSDTPPWKLYHITCTPTETLFRFVHVPSLSSLSIILAELALPMVATCLSVKIQEVTPSYHLEQITVQHEATTDHHLVHLQAYSYILSTENALPSHTADIIDYLRRIPLRPS